VRWKDLEIPLAVEEIAPSPARGGAGTPGAAPLTTGRGDASA
jgi:hypothetical protein